MALGVLLGYLVFRGPWCHCVRFFIKCNALLNRGKVCIDAATEEFHNGVEKR